MATCVHCEGCWGPRPSQPLPQPSAEGVLAADSSQLSLPWPLLGFGEEGALGFTGSKRNPEGPLSRRLAASLSLQVTPTP